MEPVVEGPNDMDWYATTFRVSVAEAEERFAMMEVARQLQAELRDTEADVFGGLWIDHEPVFAVVVNVLAGKEAQIQQHIEGLGLAKVTRIATTGFTEEQLHRDQDALSTQVPFGKDYASGIDLKKGQVEIYVATAADVDTFEMADYAASVVVVQASLPTAAAEIYGGQSISNGCTTGFSVQQTNGSIQGVSTAGHCDDVASFSGTILPWQDGQHDHSVDAQWHQTPGFQDPNKIKVNSSGATRDVTSRMNRSNMMVNDVVCKFGRITLYDCGTIDDTSFEPSNDCVPQSNATFIYVNNNADDLAEVGDSGGPVFHGNPARAWGQIVCRTIPDNGDMVFMAQNYLANIGVEVDIA